MANFSGDSTIYTYLPNGTYSFRLGARYCTVTVNGDKTQASEIAAYPLAIRDSSISIPFTWIATHTAATSSSSDTVISNALVAVGKNGLAVWQCYALGLDPADVSSVVLTGTGTDTGATTLNIATVNVNPPSSNAQLDYTLEQSVDGGATWTTAAFKHNEPTFTVALPTSSQEVLYRIRTAIILK